MIKIDPIIKTVEVSCNQETAFNIFINKMDSWWPLGKFSITAMSGGVAESIKIDNKVGGKIIEKSPDKTEYLWGVIKDYEPFKYINMDFHIAPPGQASNEMTKLEISFSLINESHTKVELKQTNWDFLNEMAKSVRDAYDGGWNAIFKQEYKNFCDKNS